MITYLPNKEYEPSQEVMKHVDAVLKLMSVLTQDDRFEEMQNGAQGEVKTMCEVLDRAIDKGRIEGRNEGRIEGRAEEIIESGLEFGLSESDILERLQRKLSVPQQKAQEYLDRYKTTV